MDNIGSNTQLQRDHVVAADSALDMSSSKASSSWLSLPAGVSYLDRLPDSIKSMILSMISLRSHLRLSMINHSWYNIAKRSSSKPSNGHYTISGREDDKKVLARLIPYQPVSLSLPRMQLQQSEIANILAMSKSLQSLSFFDVPENDPTQGTLAWWLPIPFELERLTKLTSLSIKLYYEPPSLPSLHQLVHLQMRLTGKNIPLIPSSVTSLAMSAGHLSDSLLPLIIKQLPQLRHLDVPIQHHSTVENWSSLLTCTTLTSIFRTLNTLPWIKKGPSPPSSSSSPKEITWPLLQHIKMSEDIQARSGWFSIIVKTAPNLTQIDDVVVNNDDIKELIDVVTGSSLTLLTSIGLICNEPSIEILNQLLLLSYRIVNLAIRYPTGQTLFEASLLSPLTHLRSLSISYSLKQPRRSLQETRTIWKDRFSSHPFLPYITLYGYQDSPVQWLPFLRSFAITPLSLAAVPSSSLPKKPPGVSSSSTALQWSSTFRLHINQPCELKQWINGVGIPISSIIVHETFAYRWTPSDSTLLTSIKFAHDATHKDGPSLICRPIPRPFRDGVEDIEYLPFDIEG
jgi:hypothetical protein